MLYIEIVCPTLQPCPCVPAHPSTPQAAQVGGSAAKDAQPVLGRMHLGHIQSSQAFALSQEEAFNPWSVPSLPLAPSWARSRGALCWSQPGGCCLWASTDSPAQLCAHSELCSLGEISTPGQDREEGRIASSGWAGHGWQGDSVQDSQGTNTRSCSLALSLCQHLSHLSSPRALPPRILQHPPCPHPRGHPSRSPVRGQGPASSSSSSSPGTSSAGDTMRINHSPAQTRPRFVFFLHPYLRARAWKTG